MTPSTMKELTALLVPVWIAVISSAADCRASSPKVSVSSFNPTDSRVVIHLEGAEQFPSVLYTVSRPDAPSAYRSKFSPPNSDVLLYLVAGAGSYTISVSGMLPDSHSQMIATFQVENRDTTDRTFLFPTPDIQSDDPEIAALSAQLVRGQASDYDKALAIHDWITHNIAYDLKNYHSGNFTNIAYDALSVLHRRTAICQGYSTLYAALLRAAGIRARLIDGFTYQFTVNTWAGFDLKTKPNHAWNEVWADGRWIAVDTTWDAGSRDYSSDDPDQFKFEPKRENFDMTPDFLAKTRFRLGVSE